MRESGQTIVEWLAVLAGVVALAAGAVLTVISRRRPARPLGPTASAESARSGLADGDA